MAGQPRRFLSNALRGLLLLTAGYLACLLFGLLFRVGAIERHHVESATYVFAAVWLIATATLSAPGEAEQVHRAREPNWTVPALIGFFAVSIYANTILLGLFSDDFVLAQKALDRNWIGYGEFVRPLPLALWSGLLTLTGKAAALHLFSIGLHALNAALVYSLALRLDLKRAGALAAGGLFAAFPASVEAVVWPAAVHDLIVAACALGFLVLASRRRSWLGSAGALVLLIAALLSKESAVAIPLLAAVLWLGSPRAKTAGSLRLVVAGLGVCLCYSVARIALVTLPPSFAQYPTRYMLKELISRPIATLAVPWDTQVIILFPIAPFLWGLAAIVAAATYAWRRTKEVPADVVIRNVLAMFVAVLPVYSMLFVTADLANARYLYLSTAFWVIALIASVGPPTRLASGRAIALGAAIVVGAAGVQVQLAPWREAAGIRDHLLSAAEETFKQAKCHPVSFANAPDSVRGAYIFRNGLSEALVFRTGGEPASPAGDCTFVWNGSEFLRAADAAGGVQASIAK